MKFFSVIGMLLGILAIVGLILGFLPFLGWLNWLNVPFALVGLILTALVKSKPGMLLTSLAAVLGVLRLLLGGGVI